MYCIACLGNPGRKYSKNRHNAGFLCADRIAVRYNIPINRNSGSLTVGTGSILGEEILVALPQSYMNRSGEALIHQISYNKIDPSRLIVIHDELEIPFGDVRIKKGGGHKGHNGLRSIIEQLGSPDFWRIRFGIGRPPEGVNVADYVLSNFNEDEFSKLETLADRALDCIQEIISG
jgi:peptidyl-tRNA hydrolase, PTH1 family